MERLTALPSLRCVWWNCRRVCRRPRVFSSDNARQRNAGRWWLPLWQAPQPMGLGRSIRRAFVSPMEKASRYAWLAVSLPTGRRWASNGRRRALVPGACGVHALAGGSRCPMPSPPEHRCWLGPWQGWQWRTRAHGTLCWKRNCTAPRRAGYAAPGMLKREVLPGLARRAQSTTPWHELVPSCCWSGAELLSVVVGQQGPKPLEAAQSCSKRELQACWLAKFSMRRPVPLCEECATMALRR